MSSLQLLSQTHWEHRMRSTHRPLSTWSSLCGHVTGKASLELGNRAQCSNGNHSFLEEGTGEGLGKAFIQAALRSEEEGR